MTDPKPTPAVPHACGNCEGIDPDTCLMNPDRPRHATTPAPVDPALAQRIAEAIRTADSHSCGENEGADSPALAAAVLAELAPELAHTPLICSDERHHAKVAALEAEVRRLSDLIDRLGPTEQQQRHRAERAETALTRVRELHQPHNVMAAAEHGEPADCTTCGPGTWGPDGCPTTQALTSPAEEGQP